MKNGNGGAGMNRRDAMGVLGIGAAGGVVSWLGHDAQALAAAFTDSAEALANQAAQGAAAVTFSRGAIIRTLLKDVPPESLAGGPTLFHEHLSISLSANNTPHYTADVAMMVEEAKAASKDGIACIVDGGHADMGRDLSALRRIASESGLPIIASGGYYMQRTYPADVATKTADQIADDLVRDATTGRLGAFGEIGQQGGEMTADERKVFQAIGKAHVRTGVPVFTHNAYTGKRQVPTPVPRDAALGQLDLLESVGAKPQNLAIGHVCCLDDPKAEIAIQLAKRGAFVGFDRVTLATMPDPDRVIMVMAMAEAGVASQLLLSSDFYSEPALKKNGGPGLAQTATVFGPLLIKAGMSEAMLRRILVDNPRRFLAFVPKA
jgi:phosphotriesterase-related protein